MQLIFEDPVETLLACGDPVNKVANRELPYASRLFTHGRNYANAAGPDGKRMLPFSGW